MSHRVFPNGYLSSYRQFEFEVVPCDVFRHPQLLDSMREEVFQVAVRSRGWDDEQSLAFFRGNFKIGPLYEANSAVLIRANGTLVGLGGAVNNWHFRDKTIIHLCSLGLLPGVQSRGLLQAIVALLWFSSLQDDELRKNLERGRVYISSITQSPYILAFLNRLFDVYPSPYRTSAPDQDMVEVARQVVARFDAEVPFDPESFILRNECNYFFKRLPYSSDRQINEFCDRCLRYDEGDVFVIVGRIVPDKVNRYVDRIAQHYPELFNALSPCLDYCQQL